MGAAFVFPGQGSQAPGMGREILEAFPVARHVLEEVDEALKQKLSKLIAEGPAEELTLTENAQPALMAVSMAILRVLETEAGIDVARTCTFVAGHSLGEYTALVAARIPRSPTSPASPMSRWPETAASPSRITARSGAGSIASSTCRASPSCQAFTPRHDRPERRSASLRRARAHLDTVDPACMTRAVPARPHRSCVVGLGRKLLVRVPFSLTPTIQPIGVHGRGARQVPAHDLGCQPQGQDQ